WSGSSPRWFPTPWSSSCSSRRGRTSRRGGDGRRWARPPGPKAAANGSAAVPPSEHGFRTWREGSRLAREGEQRQLRGDTPSDSRDILERTLDPWLRSHGYTP